MISIRIHMLANKGKQNELKQAVEKLCHRIAGEAGCLGCRVFQHTIDECELVLIEEWESLASIQEHVVSDNMAILAGAGAILTDSIRVFPEQDPKTQAIKNIYVKRFSSGSKHFS